MNYLLAAKMRYYHDDNSETILSKVYMQTEGAHNYFSLNEAMVRGTYENVKHHIEVFCC